MHVYGVLGFLVLSLVSGKCLAVLQASSGMMAIYGGVSLNTNGRNESM